MTLGEFIENYRIEHNLSQRQFAIKCDLSNGYISLLEKGINPATGKPIIPTLPQIQKLAIGLQMTVMELIDRVDDIPVELQTRSPALPSNIIPLPKTYKVPLLGTIACGEPILALENIECDVEVPEDVRATFALRCKGDSMINARIFDGDIVYIRQQDTVENGEIAAVLVDDEATLKRVHVFDDHIILAPENPTHKTFTYYGEDMNSVRIIGLAVWFVSKVR